jgi:hypothetical protein|tara:strand:- start:917 stop:1510 length:594 start_codon:yes stop_codon:yes gene_type:complete
MKKLAKLQAPLSMSQIDFRVQSVNKGKYVTILAYKDARVDMQRLDDVVGPLGWTRRHLRDNHNCVVSIFDEESNQWISKEDTGTESNAEAQKGLASDSFKRACFNWGIGRELYDYPSIQFQLSQDEVMETTNGGWRPSYKFNLKEWKWYAEWDVDGKVSYLGCRDANDQVRFTWGESKAQKEKRLKAEAKEAKEEAA